MTMDEIREALEQPSKENRKALARLSLELETEEPEKYRSILQRKDWRGDALLARRAYRRAYVLSRICMLLAVVVVVGAYLTGDFGMRLFEGWLNRYALAIGICVAMGLFAAGTLLLNSRRERLVAYALLEDEE